LKNVGDEKSVVLGRTAEAFERINSLAVLQARTGDQETAKRNFTKAMKLAPSAGPKIGDPNPYGTALCQIAKAQAEAGLFDLAEKTMLMPQIGGNSKMGAASFIVRTEAATGEFERAKKFAALFENNSSLFYQIAKAEAKAGRFEDAKKTSNKPKSLIEIALCEAEAGDLEAANKTLDCAKKSSEQDPRGSDCYYVLIAQAQAKIGQEEAARETVQLIQGLPGWHRPTFLRAAEIVFKFGEKKLALKMLEEAKSKARNPHKLCSIAIAEAKFVDKRTASNTFDQAWVEAEKRQNKDNRYRDFKEIAAAKATAGFHSAAEADAIRFPDQERSFLKQIARAQAKAGLYGLAKNTARKAGRGYVDQLFLKIAVLQASNGELAKARSTLRSIKNPRVYDLLVVVNYELDAGETRYVMETVDFLENDVAEQFQKFWHIRAKVAEFLIIAGYDEKLQPKYEAIKDRPAYERFDFCLGAAKGYLKRIEDKNSSINNSGERE